MTTGKARKTTKNRKRTGFEREIDKASLGVSLALRIPRLECFARWQKLQYERAYAQAHARGWKEVTCVRKALEAQLSESQFDHDTAAVLESLQVSQREGARVYLGEALATVTQNIRALEQMAGALWAQWEISCQKGETKTRIVASTVARVPDQPAPVSISTTRVEPATGDITIAREWRCVLEDIETLTEKRMKLLLRLDMPDLGADAIAAARVRREDADALILALAGHQLLLATATGTRADARPVRDLTDAIEMRRVVPRAPGAALPNFASFVPVGTRKAG